jgi:hypothetical protein
MNGHPTLKILGVAAALGFLFILSPVFAQYDAPIPGDLPLEEYGKVWDQYNQEVLKAQTEYNKSVIEIKSGTKPGLEQQAKLQEARDNYRAQSQKLARNFRTPIQSRLIKEISAGRDHRTAEQVSGALKKMKINVPIETRGGTLEVKGGFNMTINKEGPVGEVDSGTDIAGAPRGSARGSDAEGYDLYPDEAEAVARYNADRTVSNLAAVARIRFMYAAAMAAEYENTGGTDLLIRALNYAEAAVELSPRNAYYMFLPAYIYSLSAKSSPYASTMAEDYAKATLDLDPNYMEARMLLANLYLWRNSYDNALNEYENLVLDNPRYARPDTLVCMCHAYHQDDQQVRGETFFRQLTDKYPDLPMIKLARAVMLKDAGKKDDSRKVLHDILEKLPAIPEVQDAARVCLRDWFGEEVRP